MSGGHFDYSYIRIEALADQLEQELAGENINSFSSETLERLRRCERFLHSAARVAHDVEWLFSGDYGEETFAKLIDDNHAPSLNP